jgi:TRAP-type C4-dicarboxylate transport system permease small subunit
MAVANKSILITAEYSGYMFAAFVMFGLGYTFKEKAHIRITFLISRFPKRIKKFLYLVTLAIAGVLSFFMAYHSGIMVYKAYIYKMRADTVAQTLLWIPQTCLPIGFFALGLQIISDILKEFR